jgi:hypothetical protein
MAKSAIQLLLLTIGVLAAVSTAAPTEARTGHSSHIKKHQASKHQASNRGFHSMRPADRAWPGPTPPIQSGEVCPGIARSFECKIWPPPINEDPDRKMSGADGG